MDSLKYTFQTVQNARDSGKKPFPDTELWWQTVLCTFSVEVLTNQKTTISVHHLLLVLISIEYPQIKES